MSDRKMPKRWSPWSGVLSLVVSNTVLVLLAIAGTYATLTGKNSLSLPQTISLAVLVVVLVGLATWAASQVRPWWPKTKMSRAAEHTRKRVEIEWSELFRLAEKIISLMDDVVREIPSTRDMDDPKARVIHGLSRQTVKNAKAALGVSQDGFPEAAICIWRTIFEIRVNAGYVSEKNPRVAERFMEWGRMNHLRRTQPESAELQRLEHKWKSKQLKPSDPDGWTGNPTVDLIARATAIGAQRGQSVEGLNQIDLYKLANSFVHANWTASSNSMGQSDVENTDGAAEGVGEVLYLIMETACETIFISASDEKHKWLYADLWKLRGLIRGAPERLGGIFLQMPTTEIIAVRPDGKILVSAVKRREEWPRDYRERTRREVAELMATLENAAVERRDAPTGAEP